MPAPSRGGPADAVYVLLLLQATCGLLAAIGLLLVMGGNPVYAFGSLARAAVLVVLAVRVVRGGWPALVITIVLEWLNLFGVWAGVLLGLVPGLDPVITMTGLLTQVGLPVAIIWLCARLLARSVIAPRVPLPPPMPPAPAVPLPTVALR